MIKGGGAQSFLNLIRHALLAHKGGLPFFEQKWKTGLGGNPGGTKMEGRNGKRGRKRNGGWNLK